MKKLHFSIDIDAPKEKVWDTMLGEKTYRQWTKAFASGSYYEGSWNEGDKILFLAPVHTLAFIYWIQLGITKEVVKE